jgi:hypothetical protein
MTKGLKRIFLDWRIAPPTDIPAVLLAVRFFVGIAVSKLARNLISSEAVALS